DAGSERRDRQLPGPTRARGRAGVAAARPGAGARRPAGSELRRRGAPPPLEGRDAARVGVGARQRRGDRREHRAPAAGRGMDAVVRGRPVEIGAAGRYVLAQGLTRATRTTDPDGCAAVHAATTLPLLYAIDGYTPEPSLTTVRL